MRLNSKWSPASLILAPAVSSSTPPARETALTQRVQVLPSNSGIQTLEDVVRIFRFKSTAVAALLVLLFCRQASGQAPSITNMSPVSGPIGTFVTITGAGFGSSQGSSTIALNGTAAPVWSWNDTTIVASVPSGVSSGIFSVTANGQVASSTTFTVVSLPGGWSDTDVGSVGLAGSATYASGVFTVKGAGSGITGTADGMHFAYQPLSGDGTIVARVVSSSSGSQAGVMIRETLNANAADAYTISQPSNSYLQFFYRASTGASATGSTATSISLPAWVKLVRSGSSFSGYRSSDGVNWTQVGSSQTITMAQNAYIGLAVSSQSTSSLATATFDNLSISSTASPAPVITGLSATTGSVGSQVVISGSGFGATQGGSAALLNGSPLTISSWSNSSIVAAIPSGATSGPMVVSVSPGMSDSNPVYFAVTSQPLPTSWLDQDVGMAGVSGSATYASGVFTVKGAGAGITGTADGMHFVYQPLAGDGTIVARVVSSSSGSQAGVMIRETLNANAADAYTISQPYYSYIQFFYRASTGVSATGNTASSISLPAWVKVVRSGNSFSGYRSSDGVNWTQVGSSQTITMAQNAYIGLAVSSQSTSSLATATFDNISISSTVSPAPTITSLSATTGSVGSQVVISGSGFGASQGGSAALLNGLPLTISSWSNSSIVTTIPSGATSGPMVVSVAPGMNDSNPVYFAVTSQPLPTSWLDQDIGAVGVSGSATYASGVYTVKGAGSGIAGTADGMHFVYQPLSGDGTIVARVVNTSGSSIQAGVMIRETLNANAADAYTISQPYYSYIQFFYRASTGVSATGNTASSISLPAWVKVVRSGNSFSGYRSSDGVNWTQVGSSQTITMAQNAYIGLAVSSQSTSSLATATFDNISISSTVAPSPVITSLSATTGSVGSQVVISGSGFGASQGGSAALLNGLPLTISSWSNSSIVTTIPSGATSGPMVVSVAPGMNDSNPVYFAVTSQPLPTSWLDQDIGAVGVSGSATYASGVYTVKGAGSGIAGTADGMHFVYQPLSGDGTIVARVVNTSGSSIQAGVMIRETLNANAADAYTISQPYYSYIQFFYRASTGVSATGNTASSISLPAWVKVVRSGNSFSGYRSSDGVNWTQVGSSQTITMAQNAYIGLAVSSQSTSSLATATFDNISISSTVAPSPVITSLSATTGSVGSQVVISGSGFGASQGGSAALLNGSPLTISSWSNSSIVATIPSGATSGPMVVSVAPGMNDSNPIVFTVTSQPLPTLWLDQDVGMVGVSGSATYASGVFTVKGAGAGIAGTADGMHFAYQPLSGDGSIVARVVSSSSGSQAGVMIRETLNANAADAYTISQPYYSYIQFFYRASTGASATGSTVGGISLPAWVKLVRSGSTLSGYRSSDGVNWTQVGSTQTITMAQNAYIGLAVSNQNTSSLATATFDNVSISNAPLSITTGSLVSGIQNLAYGANLTANGGATPYVWSITAGSLSSGLSLNTSTGAITGTPPATGTSNFTVQVTDAKSNTVSQALSLSINAPLGVATVSVPSGTQGAAYSTNLTATGGQTPYTWSISAGSLPSGLSLNASTGAIMGTPTTTGTSNFTVQVKDANSITATQAFSLNTNPPPPLAVTTTSLPSGTQNTAYNTTLAATGGLSSYTWSISAGSLPAGLSLNASTGAITGTTTAPGTSSFTVQVKDANSSTASEVLSIVTDPPLAITTSSLPSGMQNAAYSATLGANGGQTPYMWSISAGSLPSGLSLSGSTGAINGTPTASGSSSFTLKVTDSSSPANSTTEALSIVIYPPLTITTSSLPGGTQNEAYSGTLAASGGTTPYAWSISAGSLPAGLSLNASTGTITGTPTAIGTTSFTAQVTDANSLTASQPLSIAVAPVITAVSPLFGSPGTNVTISGSGFGSTQGASTVTFNGTMATTITSWSASSIVVPVPAGATSGPVSVTVGAQTAYGPVFTVGTLPARWFDADVGAVGLAGTASYTNGTFAVSGAGRQFSGTEDAFHFAYQPLSGDGSIVARVVSIPTDAHAGVMIRETLDGASANGATVEYVPYSAGVGFSVRTYEGGNTTQVGMVSGTRPPYWVKLVRSGSTLSSYASLDGVNWTLVGNQTVNMAQNVYVGLVVNSGYASSLATVTFDNVSVNSSATLAPAITGVSATTGSIGSVVAITGANFGAAQGGSVVTLNAAPVTVNSWSATSISITIPSGSTSGVLVVSVAPSMNDSNPVIFTVTAQPLLSGWLDGDVGSVGMLGRASYANGTFTVSGAGNPLTGTADAFHFVYQLLSGDGSIVARVASMPSGTSAVAGVMIRETLDEGSVNGNVMDKVPYGSYSQYYARTTAGGTASYVGTAAGTMPPYWLRMVRSGSTLSSYASPDGVNWTLVGNQTVSMATNVYVGLVVSSGDASSLATATFDNVSVSSSATPAPAVTGVSATTGSIGSVVAITGGNFGAAQGGSVVTLNAAPVTVNSWSDTSISITIPSGSTSGVLVVSVAPSMNDSNPVKFTVTAQPLLSGWLDGDVGSVGMLGSASYTNGTFTLNGAGYQLTGTADAFHFVYRLLSGDGSIVARVASMPSGTSAVAGVMIRETLDQGSVNGNVMDYVPYGSYSQYYARTTAGGTASYVGLVAGTMPPYWLKMVRSGSTLSSYASPDGVNWTLAGNQTVNMTPNVYVGLVVRSGSTSSLATATFDNVSTSFGAQTLAPSIAGLSPSTAVPTASVTITGANFGSTPGGSTVTFNGTAATPTYWSATRIVVSVPGSATSGNVVVTVGGAASNGMPFTVSQLPSLTSLSPASGTAGTPVTITGINFGSPQGTSTVTFNGTAGIPTNWSRTSIVVPVPSGTTTGNVLVTVNGQAGNAIPFTVLQSPGITSLSTTSVTIGSLVTITGTNFGATQAASTVTFNGIGGTPASWSATSIVVPVPIGATTGNVVVTVNGLMSNPVPITVVMVSLPPVAQVQPANGATGVAENSRVVVRFAQPVQAAAIVRGTVSLLQGATSMVGTLALSTDGLSVTFTPSLNLAPNSTFTVQATDVTGNQTAPEFQSTFTTSSTTDTVAPTVAQTSPQSGDTGVPISAPIVVQFSKAMDPATLTAQSFTLSDDFTGNSVPGMVQVDPTGTTASFVPQSFLGVGRTFYVQLTSTVEDSSGNALTGSGTYYTFTTAFTADTTAPQVLGSSPSAGAAAVPLNAVIVLEFSKPLDVISVSHGLQVLSGGQPVPGSMALSNSNQRVTFTPLGGLAANAVYTVVTTAQITDVGGLALANPGTFSWTTGAAADTTTPSVTSVSPGNNETGVPVNAFVQLQFNKLVDPWTVTTATFQVLNSTGVRISGSVSSNGQTATFTPSGPLNSFATYYVQGTSGITDLEGHGLSYFQSSFTTGLATDTSAPAVVTVSPANGASSVPANVHVDLTMSVPLSAASVTNNAVVVSSGGVAVPGTVSLGSSGTTLRFVPASLLAASTTYTMTVSGFTDQAGNPVVPFTSSFTTGTSGVANTTRPAVVTVTPANGASAVAVNSTVVLTFNEAVDGTTVIEATVPVSVGGFTGVLAGSYALDGTGTVVTFTPLSPLPGNATVTVQVNSGLLDLSGNASNSFYSTFTTGTGTDTTAPVVTMVTPANGASGIGLTCTVPLTFSKSLNPNTITTNNFGLLANGSKLGISLSHSADNTVVMLNAWTLPASSTITVLATSGVTDLSGNTLANFQSEFTTGAGAYSPAPRVVSQRPGNGATGVPLNGSVVLYMSEPMNALSMQAALQVSQNGVLVNGTAQVTDNGQVVQFMPSMQWQPNALIQVFLTPIAQSMGGNSLSSYAASFTTAPDLNTTAPLLVSTSPASSAVGVPTNVVIDFAFNEALDPATLTGLTVACRQNNNWLQTAVSLLNGGTLLQVAPRMPLAPNTWTNCLVGSGIQGVNGLVLSALSGNSVWFETGAGPDTVLPAIVTVSPPNGSSNIGDNADVHILFSKPVNPLTVNASTIQLSGGGVTEVADSISFSNNNQVVLLTPHAPLPDSTPMTLAISGITDVAGNPVAPQTVQFTTGNGPDVVPPLAIQISPSGRAVNVPLNTVIQLLVNEPIDPGTVNSRTLNVLDSTNGESVLGTYSVSADWRTASFVPSAALAVSRSYYVYFGGQGITDLAGNLLTCSSACATSFTTGTTASASAPQVVGVSPANGMTAVPINAQVVIQFSEPVDGAKLAGVGLSGGGGAVNVSPSLTNGGQTLTLVPVVPLSPGTAYTLTIAGVQDVSGNVLAAPVTVTFTTGAGADLIAPAILRSSPANHATNVPTNSTVQVQFSKRIDPLTVTNTTFQMYPQNTYIPVTGTIAVSADGQTATLTPNQLLDSQTVYIVQLTNGISDLEGQTLSNFQSYLTTAPDTITMPPNIASVNPAAAFAGSNIYIDGTYFGVSQGSSTVTLNGVALAASSWSDTQIILTLPTAVTTGPLLVTVNGVASNSLTFQVYATPVITSISPGSGPAGTVFTIMGTNFGSSFDSTVVLFNSNVWNGTYATPISRTETSLTVAVPAPALTGYIYVAVDGYQSAPASFTVVPTPSVTNVSPSSGVAGTPVSITGTHFGATQGSSTLTFNGVAPASITSWSDSSIIAVPPSNVTTGPITLVVNSIQSNSTAVFTVTNPAIGSISPPAAAPGATVIVNGSGLVVSGLTTQVLFNGIAGYVTQSGGSSVTVQLPASATSGPVTVAVGSVASNGVQFTVEQPPAISSVSPNIGPYDSYGNATPITITGSGFGATQSNSTVNFFGSSTPPSIANWSDTSITLHVPGDATTGPLGVQVGGLTAYAPTWFTVSGLTQVTDSLGDQTQYRFMIQGGQWVTSASQGPGCSTCSVRGNVLNVPDTNGNVLSTTDDLGNTTTYTYDASDNMISSSKPLNATTTATTSYTYNRLSEVLTMTDPLGNTTTNTYDAHGNLLSVTSPVPDGRTPASLTQFAYDTKGELTQITDSLNHVTTLTYNPVGLIASITDAQNSTTSYQYDARGNRTAVIDPSNGAAHPTSFAYDIMNRLTEITYPDGSTVGFTYDVRGRRTSATDQNNKTTYYTYDDADRLTAVTDPANNTTQYAYDTEDNLLSITDANGHITQFAYNARGRVTQTTFPSTLAESYTYDPVGNLLSKTDRKGQTIQYVYDALYRLTSKIYPDQTAVEYAYDLAGKVQQVSDPTGTYGFAYDNMGRLIGTTTQYAYLPGLNYHNAYTYDASSNRTSLTAPDGSITAYGYDTLNRLNGLANSWAGSFGVGYDALSRRTSLARPNGVNTSYSYDSLSHLLSVLHQAGANTLDGASYSYDPAGNRTSKGNYLNGITSNYTYDTLYELTQVTQGGSTTESYTYDVVGNRLSSSGVPSYSYNSSNELTSNSSGSDTYDANGNALSDAQGRSFTWDFENRLTQVFVPGVGTTIFRYDPLGRRIAKQSPSGSMYFLYDGANVIADLNSAGATIATYLQGAGIDEPLASSTATGVSYFQADGLGTITSLSGPSAGITDTYTYGTFGITTATGANSNRFRFTGREYDSETGLYFLRARYYDPQIGRFISEDPSGFNGGLNFYVYVANSPTNSVDPFGLASIPAPAGQPPVLVPGGGSGNGWRWNPNPQNTRGGSWGPQTPLPGQGQPSASWDPDGHWDVDDGNGNRQRYDPDGKPITPQQAHGKPKPTKCEDMWNKIKDLDNQLVNNIVDWLNRPPQQNWPWIYGPPKPQPGTPVTPPLPTVPPLAVAP